jgi:hypothetical protein
MEVWSSIVDFDNYEISTLGNVRRKKCIVVNSKNIISHYPEKTLKKELCRGYLRVTLSKNNIQKRKLVHRLVAESFIENSELKPCVNHIDGNKLNNYIENLEWCTYSENEKHSHVYLGKITNGIKCRKLLPKDIPNIKKLYSSGIFQKDIALIYNVSASTIQCVLNEKRYVKHM